jgi:hypothetical protein
MDNSDISRLEVQLRNKRIIYFCLLIVVSIFGCYISMEMIDRFAFKSAGVSIRTFILISNTILLYAWFIYMFFFILRGFNSRGLPSSMQAEDLRYVEFKYSKFYRWIELFIVLYFVSLITFLVFITNFPLR